MAANNRCLRIILRIILILVGGFFVLDAVLTMPFTSFNFGIIMPFVIGLPLLILGIFYERIHVLWNKTTFGKIIKWLFIGCYAAFFLLFSVTTILITTSIRDLPSDEPDAIIVLGAGIRGKNPSRSLAYRLDKAKEVYGGCSEGCIIIVSGGMEGEEIVTEASVMKKYLVGKGVPECDIIEEDRSTSTKENFLFSDEIIKEMLGDEAKVVFVTSSFHVFRSERVAKRVCVNASGIGAKEFAPLMLNNYLRECAAIVYYFLMGRL